MFELNWPFEIRRAPIPAIFHSLQKDGPFPSCLECERALLVEDEPYLIERAFKGTEPVFEYAICLNCRDGLSDGVSQESMLKINDYFAASSGVRDRLERVQDFAVEDGVDGWLDDCLIKGLKRSDCSEYQVYAICRGNELELGFAPFMISGEAISEIADLLSEQTLGWMDDFVQDRFGMPPEFYDLPEPRPLFL